MKWRRLLWLALLVYVACDAAAPGMPGAFVFDPDASIEGADMRRPDVDGVVAPPPLDIPPAMVTMPRTPSHAPARWSTVVAAERRPVASLARSTCARAASPDDPH